MAAGGSGAQGGAGGSGAGSGGYGYHAADLRFDIAEHETGEEEIVMIGMRTWLDVADNSGARKLQCILPRGGDLGLRAGLGDVVTASVKEAAPDSAIKKGKVVHCVVVRMRKETRRRDGSYIRFDTNAAVLVNEIN